ncbi:Flagellar biosynthetic protein FlhB [uncultured Gammaproteobacteria bacterium]
MLLTMMIIIVNKLMPGILKILKDRLSFYLEEFYHLSMDSGNIGLIMQRVARDAVLAIWLPLLLLSAAGIAASILQTGWHVTWEPIKPDFSKLNPLNGFKRLFSMGTQAIELAKNVAKLAVVGTVAYLALSPMMTTIEHFTGMPMEALLREADAISYDVMSGILMVLAVIAAADLFWQRHEYNKKMKMTKQEVKDEHKQSEGDPQVKGRMRSLRIERSRKRMMANVPKADVVVTNPTHYAVALKYNPQEMSAPVVLAMGVDNLAFNIRKIAEENNIPIVRNPPLARALYDTAEIDQEIPADHYRAVAEVITYVFKLKRKSF